MAETDSRLFFKELSDKLKKNQQAAWDSCPHKAGCNPLSENYEFFYASTFTSIVWHEVNETVFGICTVCQRRFTETDPDFKYWRRQRSINIQSSSGGGVGIPTTKEEHEAGVKNQFSAFSDDSHCKAKTLDDLSDSELRLLLEKASKHPERWLK